MPIRNRGETFVGSMSGSEDAGAVVHEGVPEVTLALGPNEQIGTQTGTAVVIRATWTEIIESMPSGLVLWDETQGEPGVLIPMGIASVGSQSIWDITIPLPQDGSGSFIYVVPQQSAVTNTIGTDTIAGRGPSDNVTIEIQYNTLYPDVALTSILGPVFTQQVTIRATFTEDIGTSFPQSDFHIVTHDIHNASLSATINAFNEVVAGREYDIVIDVPESQGTFICTVVMDTVTSVGTSKMGPVLSRTLELAYDRLNLGPVLPDPPTVEIEIPPGGELPYRYETALIRFLFSEPVEDFGEAGDVTAINATFQIDTMIAHADMVTYDLLITLPDDAMGTVTITVPRNVAILATNNLVEGPPMSTSASFDFDTRNTGVNIPGTTTICFEKYAFDANPYLNAVITDPARQGGAFIGFTDMIRNGDNLYGLMQIRKKRSFGSRLNPNVEAGAVLMHFDLAEMPPTCNIIKTYEYVTTGARSFELHDGEVHFIEGFAYSSRETSTMGHVFKIDSRNHTLTDLGLNWRSDDPIEGDLFLGVHTKTISPLRSCNGKLNMVTGYGLLDKLIVDRDDKSNLIDNWQLIEYSDEANRRVSLLETNSKSGYNVLKDLALLTNSVIGFYNDQFFYISRIPYKAGLYTDIDMMTAITEIDYQDANRVFPDAGYLFIGTELFEFTGKSVGATFSQFTGVTRGAFGTESSDDIMAGAQIVYAKHYLDIDYGIVEDPINDFDVALTPHLYNIIDITYGVNGDKTFSLPEEKNTPSITEFGEKRLEISVPLTEHQKEWVKYIAEILLERFSKVRYRVEMTLKSSFYLQLGDVILLKEDESYFFSLVQVLGITHNSNDLTTKVICETF